VADAVWNEYLSWLHYAVPGMLARSNIDAMSYAIERLPPRTALVEVGSFCGLSTCVLTYLKEKHGISCPLFTSDAWAFEGQRLGGLLGDSRSVTHDDYRALARESFLRNTRTFCRGDLPHTIETDSDTFFKLWSAAEAVTDVFDRRVTLGGPIGFCYIDGNHTYQFARQDFDNTDRWLIPGGFILFDDSGDGSGWDVCRVVAEVITLGTYDLISHAPNYLFRKRP